MRPFFVVADVDLLKDITVKHFDKFPNRLVSYHITSIVCLKFICICYVPYAMSLLAFSSSLPSSLLVLSDLLFTPLSFIAVTVFAFFDLFLTLLP